MQKIIKPIAITDAMLTSTTIAETDQAAYNPATTYAAGDLVMVTDSGIHKIYRSAVSNNTGHYPPDNIYDDTVDPATGYWIEVSATNRWKMFDRKSKSASIDNDEIEVSVTPGVLCNALALIHVEAASVLVTVNDPADGLVYSREVSLVDNSEVYDQYTWCFSDIIRKPIVTLTDLPAYSTATITVLAEDDGNQVEIGELVFGTVKKTGILLFSYSAGISDYSRKETDDETGDVSINQGPYSDTLKFKIRIPRHLVIYLKRLLGDLRATPVVFIGHDDYQETIVYGFFTDFNVTVQTHNEAFCNIEVEELI